jgi:DNA-binding IclR family transcriptional regulator
MVSEWRARLAAMRASARALRLVDELFDLPVLTIPQAQRHLGISYPGAQHIIERLVEAGIIHQAGDSRYSNTYVASEILGIVAV